MKKILLLLLTAYCLQGHAQQYTIATFNLRYANTRDTGNLWPDRLPAVTGLIRFHGFDIFGTQEGLIGQLNDISTALPQFERYGVGRDDGKEKGEHSAIYYRKDKFKLLGKGDFWLSQTPDRPGFGWDSKYNRICSWVYLQDIAKKKKFYVFNVHFDHEAKVARPESAKLLLLKISQVAGNQPVLLMGDFNGNHDTEWYKRIAASGIFRDAYNEVKYPYANNGSFNAFGPNVKSPDIIDHIFVTLQFNVSRYGILTDTYQGKFPSDHFPVLADVKFR
jgi:endonuclease/exonuclease/phosphatase family metal-dependent hydrolase